MADRIGAGGVAGQLERLAAAPAEVQLAGVAHHRLGAPKLIGALEDFSLLVYQAEGIEQP
jgi:hypothetical protein